MMYLVVWMWRGWKAAVQYRLVFSVQWMAGWVMAVQAVEHPVCFLEPGSTRETGRLLTAVRPER